MTGGGVRRRRWSVPDTRAAAARRRGPVDEARWWDPHDQAWAEDLHLPRRALGRGWIEVPMLNNTERAEPLAGPASEPVLAARGERELVALDEGRAWRRRHDAVLAVLRVEVYRDPDDGRHRAAWAAAAETALEDTWRARWAERARQPGWVEATWVPVADRPEPLRTGPPATEVDWLHLEDHTEAAEHDAVTAYEYVVVWWRRAQATLIVRHLAGLDLDASVAGAAALLAAAEPPSDATTAGP